MEKIFKEAEVVVEAFDRAEEKAMLINAVSEKMPDKYIVAASGVAGYGDSNEIKTVRFSSKIFIVGDQEDSCPTRDWLDGTEGGNCCPPSGEHRLENSFGGRKVAPSCVKANVPIRSRYEISNLILFPILTSLTLFEGRFILQPQITVLW